MIGEYVYENLMGAYADRVWLIDEENLCAKIPYVDVFVAHGYDVVEYMNDLDFRIGYEEKIKYGSGKIAVLQKNRSYLPYDILKCFSVCEVSLKKLFPKLNADVLRRKSKMDLELLAMAAKKSYDNFASEEQTEKFCDDIVYGRENVALYFQKRAELLLSRARGNPSFRDWIFMAEDKAQIDRYAAQYHLDLKTDEINFLFQKFVLASFGKLSSETDCDTPILVSRAMEYMHDRSQKFALIVMDGMSEFDWEILSDSFLGISYKRSGMFAMIPSVTSVSRQCLLSGKFPRELLSPWHQNKEKEEFTTRAEAFGYRKNEISYTRGYEGDIGSFVRCAAIIINDVDDMMHGESQGRVGMYHNVSVLSEGNKLRNLTKRLLARGFDVYISADHGNTPCVGTGKLVGNRVDVGTKSHRMVVLKDFADKEVLKNKYHMIDYPKYYLPKEYEYLICDAGVSLSAPGDIVITHGGMTIDEVVVPFIKIRAEENHG